MVVGMKKVTNVEAPKKQPSRVIDTLLIAGIFITASIAVGMFVAGM